MPSTTTWYPASKMFAAHRLMYPGPGRASAGLVPEKRAALAGLGAEWA
ncbi:hypothetical protein [Streptomyces sp. NBC_01800]|nr:hypothetical protein [Streptomyces sp. NBC_01800]WSA74171.1 hypothetical protein OIE65_44650 [Streptomyces sp. NBC_01800]